jgi:hypothetical protein
MSAEIAEIDEQIADLEGALACARGRRAELAGRPEPTVSHDELKRELFGTTDLGA